MQSRLALLSGNPVAAKTSNQAEALQPNRHDKRRQRTKEAILAAAAAVFLRKGVVNTTISDITEVADIAHRTFYYHFSDMDDVISAVAEKTMTRIVEMTNDLLPEHDFLDMVPAVSVRLIMRLLSIDPAVRWLLERPYIFVDEWRKVVTPSMMKFAAMGPDMPIFTVMGGVEAWIRVFPWILISELNDAIEKGTFSTHEENLANLSVHLLGVDDDRRAAIIAQSRRIVDEANVQPPMSATTS